MIILNKILTWYFSKESLPYWCIIVLDSLIIFLSGVMTYWVLYRTMVLIDHRFEVIHTLILYVILSLIGAKVFRTYAGVIRFSSFIDLVNVAYANTLNLVIALVASQLFGWLNIKSLSIFNITETVLIFALATMGMWLLRIIVKALYDVSFSTDPSKRVLIYGALADGVGLAKQINSQRPKKYVLKGFISEDRRSKHMRLMGKDIYNTEDDNLRMVIKRRHIQAILVSPMMSEAFRNNQSLQDILIGAGCKIMMVEQAKEVKVKGGQIMIGSPRNIRMTEVSVEDLLPRDEINVDMKSIGDMLYCKRILVTGAAGSIGSEIVKQVASFKPEKMMLIDMAETPAHDMRIMMARDFPDVPAETIVASITEKERMELIFKSFKPDYVFHAAAYKHVPMMENNPTEAVLNNIYGTKIIADLSVKYGAKKFVMISTDKAVNPTNVMGCSKRICEIYVQSLNRKLRIEAYKRLSGGPNYVSYTQFVTTRFGNVLGSNGSVIPLFKEQIKNGGPVTVTDERIVRFFMLIPEACKLVLEAGTKGNGGEIFVFDMGQPVRIADLAKRMIALSHAYNVKIEYTGLREGEKLYEEVLNELEGTKPTFHEKIHIAKVREYEFDVVEEEINKLIEISKNFDNMATVRMMKHIVPEFISNNSVYEVLDAEIQDKGGGGNKLLVIS